MTKITDEEYNRYMNDDGSNVGVITLTSPILFNNKTQVFIDEIRAIHRVLEDKYIGHYCLCEEGVNYWLFFYDMPKETQEFGFIFDKLRELFEEVFVEEYKQGKVGNPYGSTPLGDASPCSCPFSFA